MDNQFKKSFLLLMEKKQRDIEKNKLKIIRDIASEKINGEETCSHTFKCESFSFLQQSNSPEKYFVIERWRRIKIIGEPASKDLKEGDIEYRISYYIISRKPSSLKKGQWVFGQYSPMIGHQDLFALLDLAKSEKTILFS